MGGVVPRYPVVDELGFVFPHFLEGRVDGEDDDD